MSSIPAENAKITRHDENKTRTQRPEQKESSSTTRRRTLRTPTARRLELRGRPSRKPLISSEAVDAGDTLRWARAMRRAQHGCPRRRLHVCSLYKRKHTPECIRLKKCEVLIRRHQVSRHQCRDVTCNYWALGSVGTSATPSSRLRIPPHAASARVPIGGHDEIPMPPLLHRHQPPPPPT